MNNTNNFTVEPGKDELVKYLHSHEIVSYHFMKKILNTNYYNAVVNEESWLSDFEGNGLEDKDYILIAKEYDNQNKEGMTYAQTEKLYTDIKYRYWTKLVCKKIVENYAIDIKSTKIVLYVIFEKIINNCNIIQLENETKKFVFDEDNEKIDWIKLKEHLDSKMNASRGAKLTKQEIEEQLKTTLDPFFYAKYTGATFVEAMDLIEERKKNQIGIYQPYRPD